ncbi:sugar transferase [Flexithrix dorotheae]|uniref:sugar transferase n=1 Tax=Flexithrix dorotheae TaxID=70993 RepID=UPI001FE149DD|nr:sugar transferase [Flexithrix dorotheae]
MKNFIQFLISEGFYLSPDKQLEITYITDTFGKDVTTKNLKNILSPIIVNNKQEQERFFHLFNLFFIENPIFSQIESEELPNLKVRPPHKKTRSVKYNSNLSAFLGVFITIITLITAGFFFNWYITSIFSLLGLITFVIVKFELYNFIKAKEILFQLFKKNVKIKEPPYKFNFQISLPKLKLFDKEKTDFLYYHFNKKSKINLDSIEVNVPGTLQKTIKSAGFINLVYQDKIFPIQYLVLIDENSFNNHLLGFFNAIIDCIKTEGIDVKLMYYKSDFRRCIDENREVCNFDNIDYQGKRLIFFSDGNSFIDHLNGGVFAWIKTHLLRWGKVGLISSKPIHQWSYHEKQLDNFFYIAPASLDAFLKLIRNFDSTSKTDYAYWKNYYLKNSTFQATTKDLEERLNEKLFHWICSCAIYPEIDWNLTLNIAKKLESFPGELINLDSIKIISKIDWFRDGKIPYSERLKLLSKLPQEYNIVIRNFIVNHLQKSVIIPPINSFANDIYTIHLLRNKIEIAKNKSSNLDKQLINKFKTLYLLSLKDNPDIIDEELKVFFTNLKSREFIKNDEELSYKKTKSEFESILNEGKGVNVKVLKNLGDNITILYFGSSSSFLTKNENFNIVNYSSCEEGLTWIVNNQHLVVNNKLSIFCELSKLDSSFYTFLEVLQQNAKYKSIPKFVLTKNDFINLEDKKQFLKKGIDDIFYYNNHLNDIESRIKMILNLKSILEKEKIFNVDKERTSNSKIFRRFIDIIFSSLSLIILSPVFLLICIMVKLDSKGAVFYISKRVGMNYKIFNFYKFRTMVVDADKKIKSLSHLNQYSSKNDSGVFFMLNKDPSITRVGSFLRISSLDELPQLVNVLFGQMSLVGNRPLPIYEAASLTRDEWAERFLAPAGITGLWQVEKRGRRDMSVEERINLDIQYAKKNNFWNDILIMLKTIPSLIQKEDL